MTEPESMAERRDHITELNAARAEGARAERERIRQLAGEHGATYPQPCTISADHPAHVPPMHHRHPFADLLEADDARD